MKRNFLLFCVFFLNACSYNSFKTVSGCPVRQGQITTVSFEYGSAELNENAVRELEELAQYADRKDLYVCLWGRLSYHGASSMQSLGAIDRIKNTAAIFLKEGVYPERIFMGISAQNDRIGLDTPLTAKQEEHTIDIMVGEE